MTFTNPTYLWALWGLLLPLIIHLWSKRQARTIKVGSVELLVESQSRQSRNLQLNEWALLLLRLLIVALVVLLMAGPQWRGQGRADPVAYLVEASLADHQGLRPLLDSLSAQAQVLLLQQGFPPWGNGVEPPSRDTPPYWQLVQGMDSLPPDSLVIFVRAHLKGVQGKRPSTHKKIHWVVLEGQDGVEIPLLAKGSAQGPVLVSLQSNAQRTAFRERPLPGDLIFLPQGDSVRVPLGDSLQTLPLGQQGPLEVHIHEGPAMAQGMPYMEAALSAISQYLQREITIKRFGDGQGATAPGDLNIWSDGPPPQGQGGHWLIFREDPMATALIERKGDRLYHLTAPLTTDNTVTGHLARQLLPLLVHDPILAQRAKELDRREMDLGQLRPRYDPPRHSGDLAPIRNLAPWVLMALALLLFLERWISKIRQQ